MKKMIIIFVLIAINSIFAISQTENNKTVGIIKDVRRSGLSRSTSDIKIGFKYEYDSPDLLSILRFENINLEKISLTGNDLKDKYFVITIKEFNNGKLAKEEIALDSNELGDLGKIKGDNYGFRVLTKRTSENTAKFQFQFDRFSTEKEFKVGENFKGFVLKNFLGGKTDLSIPVNESTYILTYMMPYMKADGSGAYCEVAQSGVNPEEFGTKYAIPTYFLISIKFV